MSTRSAVLAQPDHFTSLLEQIRSEALTPKAPERRRRAPRAETVPDGDAPGDVHPIVAQRPLSPARRRRLHRAIITSLVAVAGFALLSVHADTMGSESRALAQEASSVATAGVHGTLSGGTAIFNEFASQLDAVHSDWSQSRRAASNSRGRSWNPYQIALEDFFTNALEGGESR